MNFRLQLFQKLRILCISPFCQSKALWRTDLCISIFERRDEIGHLCAADLLIRWGLQVCGTCSRFCLLPSLTGVWWWCCWHIVSSVQNANANGAFKTTPHSSLNTFQLVVHVFLLKISMMVITDVQGNKHSTFQKQLGCHCEIPMTPHASLTSQPDPEVQSDMKCVTGLCSLSHTHLMYTCWLQALSERIQKRSAWKALRV